MQRTPTKAESHTLYERLIAGERVVVNREIYNSLIDHCGCRNRMDELASCQNSKRVGTLDENVAWIGDENKPTDLVLQANGSMFRGPGKDPRLRSRRDTCDTDSKQPTLPTDRRVVPAHTQPRIGDPL